MVELKNGLYVGCALTHAPDYFKKEVEDLKDTIRADYKILDFIGHAPGTPEEVYDWDIEQCVKKCDAMLAVVDYSSLGLGYEMATADHAGKPTLMVARIGREVSRLVLGAAEVWPSSEFERYAELWEVPEMLDRFLGQRLLSDYFS